MSSTKCAQQSLLEQPNKYHNMDQVCNWQSCPELPFIQCLGICYANKCLLSLIPTCLKRCCSIQDYETIFTPDDKNLSTTCCVSCQHFGRLWEWEWWRAYLQSQCDFFPFAFELEIDGNWHMSHSFFLLQHHLLLKYKTSIDLYL